MPTSTAALIARKDKFLFVRRPPGGDLSGRWEFPGGKADPGESPEEALRRELIEELAIEAQIGDLAAKGQFEHRGMAFDLLAFYLISPLHTEDIKTIDLLLFQNLF